MIEPIRRRLGVDGAKLRKVIAYRGRSGREGLAPGASLRRGERLAARRDLPEALPESGGVDDVSA
jgi:hypothetical protein